MIKEFLELIAFLMLFLLVSILITVSMAISARADEVEVLGGALTYHLIDNGTAHAYSNKLSSDGRLISNPMAGVAITTHENVFFQSYAVFFGEDSVGGSMGGGSFTSGVEVNRLQVGAIAGGYIQAAKPYTDRNVNAFRLTAINGTDFVPLLGLAINYKVPLSSTCFLKLNNIISPILTTSLVSVGFNY